VFLRIEGRTTRSDSAEVTSTPTHAPGLPSQLSEQHSGPLARPQV